MDPIIAQVPPATPNEFGIWILICIAVIGAVVMILTGINQVRTLMRPTPKQHRERSDRFVTRAELERVEKTLSEQFSKHESYTRDRLHELGNTVNNVNLKMAEQPSIMRAMIDASLAPLVGKMDRMGVVIAAIGVKLNLPSTAVDGISGD